MIPTLTELLPFLALAALGSLHCAGMCGTFAIAATSSARAAGRGAWLGTLSYVFGKALTYALLGALVASVGGLAVRSVGTQLELARVALGWIVGIALCFSGLAALGLRIARAPNAPSLVPMRWARSALATVRQTRGLTASFGVGVLTGLLPCGLSWSALMLALQSRPSAALVGLFAFGIATGPALFGVASGWSLLPAVWRVRARFALGPMLILLGATTIARAHPGALPEPLRTILPACCTSER